MSMRRVDDEQVGDGQMVLMNLSVEVMLMSRLMTLLTEDVVGPVDADVVQQMVLCKDVLVDEFCFGADGS